MSAALHVEARDGYWQVTEVFTNSRDLRPLSWAVVVEPVRGKPTRRVRIGNRYGNLLNPKAVYAARALAAVREFNESLSEDGQPDPKHSPIRRGPGPMA